MQKRSLREFAVLSGLAMTLFTIPAGAKPPQPTEAETRELGEEPAARVADAAAYVPQAYAEPSQAGAQPGADPALWSYRTPDLPVEGFKEWEEVLKALPKDIVGGVDWVRAIKEGVVAPSSQPDPSIHLDPPFTLDTLVPGITSNGMPPLDLDIPLTPEKDPFFKVIFPHSSHTLWLNCSSCHPGVLLKRVGMSEIFAGEYCGACHGKVAFAPESGCARCHVNLVPPDEEEMATEMATARENPVPATPELLAWGKNFYQGLCAICHGEQGDGNGPFAPPMDPKPRDFTEGTFKFRSTPSGSLPIDLDVFRTITMGLKGTGMPAWYALPAKDRWALVHYIKTFSEIFDEEEPDPPIVIPDPPPSTPELIAEGKEVYEESKCWDCHGHGGRADGPSANRLQDDWGAPILPADFTSGVFKSGSEPRDVFRSVSTGLDGSPMPSYGDILSEEQRWALSYYVTSLGKEPKGFGITGNIAFSRYTREAVEQPPAMFPHWFHRIRFRCAACHPRIFQMKAGANPITMEALRKGEFCARCHNGTIAWYVGFETCRRCHGGA